MRRRNHELERTYHAQRTASQTTQRQTFDEWRNQVALDFLGDPNRRAVVYPAPTARRCQVMTDRGAVHFDARRDLGALSRFPSKPSDDSMPISGFVSAGAEQRAQNEAVMSTSSR